LLSEYTVPQLGHIPWGRPLPPPPPPPPPFIKIIISATLVIRKWSHAISKYNEATPVGYFLPETTKVNHSLLCLWKLPHSHIPFSSCWPECRCLFHSHGNGVHAWRRCSTHLNEQKSQSRYGWVTHLRLQLLPKQSNMIPLQNHYMDLEPNEYHNTYKGKASNVHDMHRPCLITLWFTRTIRIHARKCHMESQT
jgi:hypothetical protein